MADILQDALKKIQTVAGSTTTSSVSTLPPTGSSVQNSAASPSFGHNISNTPRSTAQNININPSPPNYKQSAGESATVKQSARKLQVSIH